MNYFFCWMLFVLFAICRNGKSNLGQTASCCSPFELRRLFAFPKQPEVVFYTEGRWLTQAVVPCSKSSWKGLGFSALSIGLEGDPSLPPTSPQQLLATASTVLLQMLGRNFKKDCCSYSLLPRRENGTSEKSVGECPRVVINFGEWGWARKGGGCLLLCLCKASLPLLAFDAVSPSQTGWRTGLSVLDLAHPTQLKSRECFSPVIPKRRMLTACLSAACSRRQWLAAIQDRPLLWAKRVCKEKKRGSRRGREKGKWDMHTSSN